MSAAIDTGSDDAIAVTKDSIPSTTTTTTQVIKQQPLIQVYFPITHLRPVDIRLPAARSATVCGIHYSYIFLASLSLPSLDMPKISRATQARLLRKSNASIPASSPSSSSSPSTLLSASEQSIPTNDTSTNNNDTTISPSPKTTILERESNNSNNNEAFNNNDGNSSNRDMVSKESDDNDSEAISQLATAATVDKIQDNMHALEPAIPTPHLSTPPSRSSSSSRIPIRKSNSMPTAKSPEAVTTRRAPTPINTPQHKRKQGAQQQQIPHPRPASPKPSTTPIRNKTTMNRSSSSKSMTKVREADVPMPKKPMPTNSPMRTHGAAHRKNGHGNKDQSKQGNEDEEDEAPVRITAQERRRRENMRAQQIKMWRVREEREARDARTIARRKMMERPTSRNKEPSPPPTPPRRAVKFNLKRNKVIEISQ